MAQYDPVLNVYVLDATDVDPFVMPAEVGNAAVIGDDQDNVIKGNAGNNKVDGGDGYDDLEGGTGNDSLIGGSGDNSLKGGAGDDVYHVHLGDVVIELAGEGFDTVIAYSDYSLPSNVERLQATDTPDGTGSGDYYLTGNALNNIIIGGTGWDYLDGDVGADTLQGGLGDDAYDIDSQHDAVIELEDQGYDSVHTLISYTLGAHVEDLSAMFGAADLALTGNELNNHIAGTYGADTIDGGIGADILYGREGNDTFIVDDLEDWIYDDDGIDHVITSVNYRLSFDLENLSASGTAPLTLTGNSDPNKITGNAAANVLDGGWGDDTLTGGAGNDILKGGEGIDRMAGGTGNDTYYADIMDDRALETSGGGIDKVITTGSFFLSAHVENLSASGSGSMGLAGNTLANVIRGNSGSNIINGALGKDTLYGGTGKDTFIFSTKLSKTANLDKVVDYKVADDVIHLSEDAFLKLNKTGALSKSYFVTGSKAKDKNDYIVYDNKTGYLYYDADGSGKGAAVAFAKLAAGLKMAASEFKVI